METRAKLPASPHGDAVTVLRYLVHLHRATSGEIDDITIEARHGTVTGDLFLFRKGDETSWIEGYLAFQDPKEALDSVRLTIRNRLRVWEALQEKFAAVALGAECAAGDVVKTAEALK